MRKNVLNRFFRTRLAIILTPVLLFLLLGTIIFLSWKNTSQLSRSLVINGSLHHAEAKSLRLESLLHERLNDLSILASMWKSLVPQIRSGHLQKEADGITLREPIYHVINYIDPDNIIRISAPSGKVPRLVNLDLNTLPGRRKLLRKVIDKGGPTSSPIFTLTTGDQGLIIRYPMFVKNDGVKNFDGMLAAALKIDSIIQQIVEENLSEEMMLRITLNDSVVFLTERSETISDAPKNPEQTTASFTFLDGAWKITAFPRPGSSLLQIPEKNTRSLVFNLLLSAGASLLLALALFSLDRSAEIFKSNQKLQEEIDNRKMAEEALRKWGHIFAHTDDGMATVNEKTFTLDITNPAFTRLYDLSEEKLAACEATALFAPVEQENVPDYFRKAARNGHHYFETIHCRADGTTFPAEVNITFITESEGVAPYYVLTVHDITNRKKVEADQRNLQVQLTQSQKLQTVGRLAGGLAHDFNNILSAIIGYSEMALLDIDKDHPLHEPLEVILDSGNKAAALTRQLLAFSRRQVLEMKVLDINETIENMFKMLVRLIGEDINIDIQAQRPLRQIMADPSQVEQVLMNLTINARDAMPNGGKITIKTNQVDIFQDTHTYDAKVKPGSYVLITVTDTGIGMAQEIQEQIFEPFFTTKEMGKGTGLGLATVYGIVKQHQGYIFVSSEIGQGTTFKIYMPSTLQIEEQKNKTPRLSKMPSGTETIMLVEDDYTTRKLLLDVLSPLGYTIIEAANGQAAKDLCQEHEGSIDLLLTDVIMPEGINGRQVADVFEKKWPAAKIVFMSGYTDDIIAQHGILEPGTTLIHKPLTPINLANRVRKILDG